MGDRTFTEVQEELAERWGTMLNEAKTDEERGKILLDFIYDRERLRNGIGEPGLRRDALDRATLATLSRPVDLGPEHSALEVVFRRLVEEPASALLYLESAVRQRSAAQSRRAGKPRPGNRDSITKAIEEILEDSPKLAAKEVGQALKVSYSPSLGQISG